MRTARPVSLLGYAVLGLLRQNPCSGYDLRKIFATTPMSSFSDSPGAIYPALRRLEKDGLIRGRIEDGPGVRRRQIFRPTPQGTAALKNWLAQRLGREDVVRHLNGVMLRFAFMDGAAGKAASIRLLKRLEEELDSYIPTLHEYLAAQQANMPLSGRLALESGVRRYECLLQWAQYARATYEQEAGRKPTGRTGL
jgi:DNA-binding PadR family transcriptional regulator